MTVERITYKQLDDLLVHLGFSRQRVEPRWLRYEHTPSDTVIALPAKAPHEAIRITDVVSASRHLVEKGFITEARLDGVLSSGKGRQTAARDKKS
jgi:hypothetical protein